MTEEPILDALGEAFEAAAAVFRRRAAQARPLWPAEEPASSVLDRARQMHPTLGPRQAAVLSELEAAGGEGTTPGAIARALNYDPPDTHTMLGALANQGLVNEDRSVYPQVYRLSPALLGGAAGGSQPDD
jgi:DNA-binding MarR family transcriptional regulator